MKHKKDYLFRAALFFLIFCQWTIVFAQSDLQKPSLTSSNEEIATPAPVKDPYEKFNRHMFNINDGIDKFLLKPAATFYNWIVPKPLNLGIHNFFNNINTLPIIANDILQFNFYMFMNDVWRVGINSTFGIGGLFDVASRIGLKYHATDFGLTLAFWGYKNSNYLVLPFYGPNTVRDMVGIPIDYYPFSIYPWIRSNTITWSLFGGAVLDRRAQLLKYQSVLDEVALDKYVFIRNAYMQRRNLQIQQTLYPWYMIRANNQHQAQMGTYPDEVALKGDESNGTLKPNQFKRFGRSRYTERVIHYN